MSTKSNFKVTIREDGSRRVQSVCEGKSLTKQDPGQDVDIQKIVAKALRGQPVSTVTAQPSFLDVSALPDYQASVDRVAMVNNVFSGLNAVVRRDIFGNNPENMVAFLGDSANYRKAVELGLLDASILAPAEQAQASTEAGAAPIGAEGTGA